MTDKFTATVNGTKQQYSKSEIGEDAKAKVESKTRKYPPSWDRDTEPVLTGEVKSHYEVKTFHGRCHVSRILKPDGTSVSVWFSPQDLWHQWKRASVQRGDSVTLTFKGTVPTDAGYEMHVYDVENHGRES